MDDTRSGRPLKILMVAAEVAPFAKVGGLADVAGALPLALHADGHDVRVALPLYGMIDPAQYRLQPVLHDLAVPLNAAARAAGAPAPQAAAVIEHAGGPADRAPAVAGQVPVDVLQGTLGPAAAVPVYFIRNAYYFDRPEVYGYPDDDERFILFCRAVLEMLPGLDWTPDIIHCNDWHTASSPTG